MTGKSSLIEIQGLDNFSRASFFDKLYSKQKYCGQKLQWQIKMNKMRNLKILFVYVYTCTHMYIDICIYSKQSSCIHHVYTFDTIYI